VETREEKVREARRKYYEEYRAKNPEKVAAANRRYRENHPDRVKAAQENWLLKQYGE